MQSYQQTEVPVPFLKEYFPAFSYYKVYENAGLYLLGSIWEEKQWQLSSLNLIMMTSLCRLEGLVAFLA